MKKLGVIVLVMALALAVAVPASAVCTSSGVVVAASSTGAVNSYFVRTNFGIPDVPVVFVYQTNNQTFMNILNAAAANGRHVIITGNAAACPGAGAVRNAGLVTAARFF